MKRVKEIVKMKKDNKNKVVSDIVQTPVNDQLSPKRRLLGCIALSELMTKMATHVICHTIVEYEEQLKDERLSVASAFLQRAMSTHLCNHKLTKEGISLNYQGEEFPLHEEFKTMALTRSVYEHLVMFYFLFCHPKNDEERSVVWNYWKINSMKNLLDYDAGGHPVASEVSRNMLTDIDLETACEQIEALRTEIFSTSVGALCRKKLDEWTMIGKPTQNGCIEFYRKHGHVDGQAHSAAGMLDVRRVSYNQAWKYLFKNDREETAQLYRHLSIHCHPIYNGLLQYQGQALKDEGNDGVPLYLSCCFLAYLCRLFLRLIPKGHQMFDGVFSSKEIQAFKVLSQIPSENGR